MLRKIASLCSLILSRFRVQTGYANDSAPGGAKLTVEAGDLIVQQSKGEWSSIKILAVDAWPDGSFSAHCLNYRPVPKKPTIESLRNAAVLVWHAPIDAASFQQGWERVGNEAPTKGEFIGFVEYLRLTNFPRYIAFTGLDPSEIVRKANEHYQRAYALGNDGNRVEAIAEYSLAIDLFPLFYEAIDNRAFTYMELGQFKEALLDFEESLQVNPTGVSAFFSKGECLLKLGEFMAAEKIFQEGQVRFPAERAMFTKFLEQVRARQRNG